MALLIHRGNGPWVSYAGQPVHILAGQNGQPAGFASMELTTPLTSPGRFLTHTTNSTRQSTCSADGCW